MGRSGKKNKYSKNTLRTRAAPREEMAQGTLFNTATIKTKDQSPNMAAYSPGPDHEELIDDAVERWSFDPDFILNPNKALSDFVHGVSHAEKYPEKCKLSYWQKALAALIWESNNGIVGPQTLYRGQAFEHDHPLNRIRSWTTDPRKTVDFATRKYYVGLTDNPRTSRTRTGIELSDGEVVFIRIYEIQSALKGLNINQFLEERRKRILIKKIFDGGKGLSMIFKDEDGFYREKAIGLEEAKEKVIVAAKEKIGSDRTAQIIADFDQSIITDDRERGIPVKNIEVLLKEIKDPDLTADWLREKDEVVSRITESQYGQEFGNIFAKEEEVIIHPSEEDKIRYIDIPVAKTNEELQSLTNNTIADRIEEAVSIFDGDRVRPNNSRQEKLFYEGVHTGPYLSELDDSD